MEADENIVTGRSLVPVEQNSSPRASIALPDMKQWYFLLSEQKYDQMLMELKNYFLHDNVEMPISRTDLMQVLQDFDQMLYVLLRERSISARLIFATEQGTELRRNAPNSVSDTMTWCFWAVTQVSQHLMQEERGKNYIEQVKTFIQQHLNQAFTRQDIADYVHLSQNHLARLFKKETGMSISDYIIQERMNRAFELLQNTNLPVGEVALRVGYENYSYFLTLFRRVTDLRPSEYRARHQAQKGDPTWTEKH
jgi:two-component system response regulator YesN